MRLLVMLAQEPAGRRRAQAVIPSLSGYIDGQLVRPTMRLLVMLAQEPAGRRRAQGSTPVVGRTGCPSSKPATNATNSSYDEAACDACPGAGGTTACPGSYSVVVRERRTTCPSYDEAAWDACPGALTPCH